MAMDWQRHPAQDPQDQRPSPRAAAGHSVEQEGHQARGRHTQGGTDGWRSALGRAPHKTAGGLLLAAGATIVIGIITAEALYTAPYNARMEISDLGASETGVILQPSSTIFNPTMLAAGAMIIAAAWFAHQALHRRAVTIPTGLLGIGVLGVGIFPGNIHPQHPLFAFTAFVAGGLAVLLSAKVTPQPLRAIFAVMGAISLPSP